MDHDNVTIKEIIEGGPECPSGFDLLDRFRVVMEADTYPIRTDDADGYFTLHQNGEQIGLWLFKVVDGLVGPDRARLLNWVGLFRELQKRLEPYMVYGVTTGNAVIRGRCVPYLTPNGDGVGYINLFERIYNSEEHY